MHVAVVDLGKSNAKLALVDTDEARELRVETMPTPLGSSPYPHIDVGAIADFIEARLAAFARESAIDAVTVTTHGATAALIDGAGELVLPVLDYEHEGIDETRGDYDVLRAPFAETGSPALPGGLNLGAQLFWLQRRHPERFARASTMLTWPQYWAYRLCGVRANDATSLGCHTDLHSPASGGASALVERAGWGALMPPVRRSGERLGTLDAALAARTGLSATTPVHVGIHDSNASLVPHLIDREGPVTVVSSGTWVIAMALGGRSVALDERRDTLLNVDALGNAVPSARFMGGRERALLLEADKSSIETEGSVAAGGEPRTESGATSGRASGPDGPYCEITTTLTHVLEKGVLPLPAFVRGTGPWPEAGGGWAGDERTLSANERKCAVSAYLAFVTAECIALIGGEGAIVIEGPLASDPAYALALTAVTGEREVLVSDSLTGTAVGAAMLVSAPRELPARRSVASSPELVSLAGKAVAAWRARVAGLTASGL